MVLASIRWTITASPGSVRHRVDAMATEGVTAQDPAQRQEGSPTRPMAPDGVQRVVRARGPVPARRRPPGAKCLVETDNSDERGTDRAAAGAGGDRSIPTGREGGRQGRGGAHGGRPREADVIAAVTCAFKSS